MAYGLVAGCGGNEPWSIDPGGYDGLGEETFPLLVDPCTIDVPSTTMSLQLHGGETLYLGLRGADNTVVADALTGTFTECAAPSTYKVVVTENGTHPGVEKVFLDYINGPFSLGSTTAGVATAGISLTLGAGSSLVVRGSSAADKIYLGSTYGVANVLAHSWINVNGDTSPDVRLDGVTDVKVSTGVGADIISADGGNGTTGLPLDATIAFSAYGGPDADTLTGGKGASLLNGGDGDDKFIQTLTIGADNIVGGKGVDTVDYSLRVAAVNVTVCTVCVLAADPGNCVATDTTCRGTATTAFGTCTTAAGTALTTCTGAAATALGTCTGVADAAQTACKTTTPLTNCALVNTTCVTAAAGDPTALALCASALTDCNAACDATHTTATNTCNTTNTTSLTTCTVTNTTALATCGAVRTTSNDACDATEATCQASNSVSCSVCVADDGAVAEGDTVNDDVEIVLGGKGADHISAAHAVCSDGAVAPTVKCTLKGNDGDDILIGSAHNDLIDGGAGNDLLQGGLGDNTMIGGAGVDTVSYADRLITVKVTLDATKPWVASQNGEAGQNDSIAADIENLTGGAGDDLLRGNGGNNIIHGGAGNDTIEGGAGNDALYGEAGSDILYGGLGNDLLNGGLGADSLYGGDGDDLINSVDSPAANDTVIDCDGVNDLAGTASSLAGTADGLVKDSSDSGALNCEL
jgi:Ca2+-binding RTX toxin-like protein